MNSIVNILFNRPGALTTIQDNGRILFRSSGVPMGGAMDTNAYEQANYLVDNPPNSPVFEITLIGPHLTFDRDCQIAITGADLQPQLNGSKLEMYQTININSGDNLKFANALRGMRCYLAIRGEWMIPSWLNSYSAAFLGRENYLPESQIKKNQTIKIKCADKIENRSIPETDKPDYISKITLNFLPGPEYHVLSDENKRLFTETTWTINPQSNRMGYRLEGGELIGSIEADIISSGVIPGTIQISHSGQPIVLMRDAQTTGGYARIAIIPESGICQLSQMKPGDTLKFRPHISV